MIRINKSTNAQIENYQKGHRARHAAPGTVLVPEPAGEVIWVRPGIGTGHRAGHQAPGHGPSTGHRVSSTGHRAGNRAPGTGRVPEPAGEVTSVCRPLICVWSGKTPDRTPGTGHLAVEVSSVRPLTRK